MDMYHIDLVLEMLNICEIQLMKIVLSYQY